MSDYTVQPFVGVGPVRFGMSRDEVCQVMPEASRSFRKTPTEPHEVDLFHQSGFQIFYEGQEPMVEYIELSRDSGIRAHYRDLEVFATPADEVVAYIARDAAFDEKARELPYSYIFPGLQLSLWRPVLPEDDDAGRYFSTIGIGRK